MQISIARNTMFIVAIAILATFSIAFPARLLLGQPVTWINWAMWIAIPAAISAPLSYLVFRQSERLKQAHRQLSQAHGELEYRASHDPMTGLCNREHFMSRLSDLERSGASYTLLIFDADHFKKINDSHGHPEGDRALMLIANALLRSSREQDIVGRIGGEEFGALLIGAEQAEGSEIAERMRRAVERIPWTTINGKKTRLTVSVGGAVGTSGVKSTDVLRDADSRLYQAKRGGRNRVAFEKDDFAAIASSSVMMAAPTA